MYKEIEHNKTVTWLILLCFFLFFIVVGYVFGRVSDLGYFGIFLGLLISLPTTVGGYFMADTLVLSLAGARKVERKDYPELFNVVQNLSISSGLPMPAVYIIDDMSMNAFATGRDPKHAAIAVTSGLLSVLSKTELEAVAAHEMAHIKNFDTRLSMILVVFVGLISVLADFFWRFSLGRRNNRKQGGGIFMLLGIIFIVLSPFVAKILQMSLSRNREYLADAEAALLTRYPEGLALALEKLTKQDSMMIKANNAMSHLYIVSPLDNLEGKSRESWWNNLFATHPPIEDRIKRLREMSL